jgi:hypothetical protein
LTLESEKKFGYRTPFIKKAAAQVVMYSPKLAKKSIKKVREIFEKSKKAEKQEILIMLRQAKAIAMSNAKSRRKGYTRKQRENFFEVAIMYGQLRRDLEYEMKVGKK